MAFTNVPLRRAIPTGVSAFLVQYAVVFVLFSSRVENILRSKTIDPGFAIGSKSLWPLIEPSPPPWKMAGWMLHSTHGADLVVRLPKYGVSPEIDLVAHAGGWVRVLYLLPPVMLFVAGYLVARTSQTYGAHGEDYAGASIALGYALCYFVSAPVFAHIGESARAEPNLLAGFFVGCLLYPVVFGWLGGRVARLRSRKETNPAGA